MIGRGNWQQVLVFTRTKHGANHLAEQLNKDGIRSAAIHGNKSQGARTRALADFKSGDIRVLVATDIAARGLDIEELPHVVNYELPNVPEDYVHRIGRTGRAAATGEALSLVCVDEHKLLRDIEKLLKKRSHALRRRAMSRTRRLKRSRFRTAVSSAAAVAAVVDADKIRGAGRSQQPRRQDSGAAKAKTKTAHRRGETRWRQSTSAASPAQNHACPVNFIRQHAR